MKCIKSKIYFRDNKLEKRPVKYFPNIVILLIVAYKNLKYIYNLKYKIYE
jgi:hypothetical protein